MTVIKHYSASWCQPCKALKPIMQEIVSENPSVRYTYIDVDQDQQATQQAGIRSVPTVVIEKNGIEINRFVGVQPKSTYQQAIL